MVSLALPSPTPFIRCLAKPFLCCRSALPGEKSGCSLLIHRPSRSARYHWPGPISPCLILFWLWLLAKLCYVGMTYSNSRSYSGRSNPTVRRDTDMVQQVTAHHLTRLACLYVRQSTLQQVLENTESTSRQYALRERARALGWADERIVVIDQDLSPMIAQKRPPAWPSWARRAHDPHVLLDRAFAHTNTELEQLASNALPRADCP